MKQYLLIILLFVPVILLAQNVDSAAIKQVDSLIQLSRNYSLSNELDKAMEANQTAEKIAMEKIGRDSPEYGSCCYNHGLIEHKKGNYTEAERWYLQSQDILENSNGQYYEIFIESKINIAFLYKINGEIDKAEQIYLQYLPIAEKLKGKEDYIYNIGVFNFANLYNDLGLYEKAEPLYLESLNSFQSIENSNAQYYAMSNLGLLYFRSAQYEKAEKLYRESLPILKNNEPMWYASCNTNLANINTMLGNYGEAEIQLLEALSITKKNKGKVNLDYTRTLGGLAELYLSMGRNNEAVEIDLEALSLLEKIVGKEHIEYGWQLNNLGMTYKSMENYNKAESLLLESIAIIKELPGEESEEYLTPFLNLADLYSEMGDYERAEQLYIEGIPLLKKTIGSTSPEYGYYLSRMGSLYAMKGEPAKMDSLYKKAFNILNNSYEKSVLIHMYANLSMHALLSDQSNRAEEYILKLQQINREPIEKAIHYLSEDELNQLINLYFYNQELTYYMAYSLDSDTLIQTSYNNTLFYKGFLLQSVNRLRRLAKYDPLSTEKYNQLKSYQRLLANQYSAPTNLRDSAQITTLELKANNLEKDLARTVAGFEKEESTIYWQDVRKSLQPGAIALEFVNFADMLDTSVADYNILYAAFVLRPDDSAPDFIPLFEEKQLDSLLHTGGQRKADYVNHLYSLAERGGVAINQPQQSLYDLIWEPLSEEMEGVETIYFSPTGLLHRLNLAAIPLNEEESLGDRYELVRLNSTRQLVIKDEVESPHLDAIVYGGIEYEMDSTAIAAVNQNYNAELVATRGELSFEYTDNTSRGDSWNYLSWTDKEVDQIGGTLSAEGFKTNLFKGYSATEESFKSIGTGQPSPRVIHLATHGYFFPDPKDTQEDAKNMMLGLEDTGPVFKISEHPMIRSGLIMAGGNHAWKTGKPISPGMEDGILTAYEISQIDLSNTELVVLSACETGLGDIEGNEGVYGLQRAFKIAGAKYLIMSLWQVPDRETMEFMKTFYAHWLEDEMEIPEAFRVTQLEMRDRFLNPYAWAGFVLVE